MANIRFKFDRKKAIEAILYLANKVTESVDIYGICKLLYFADKVSLEQYGCFIFGETYSAMEQGATPSHAYNLLKHANEIPLDGIRISNNDVIALRKANIDCLSESDTECLDKIIEIYGNAPVQRWTDAHDNAWKINWEKRGTKGSKQIPVEDIAELFNDSDVLIDYLTNVG